VCRPKLEGVRKVVEEEGVDVNQIDEESGVFVECFLKIQKFLE